MIHRFKAVQPWATLLLGIYAAGVVLMIVGCADKQSPPAAAGPSPTTADQRLSSAGPAGASIPAGPDYTLIDGRRYSPKAGPIRADLLDVERLQLRSLRVDQGRKEWWPTEPTVYALPTMPVEKGVLLRFPADGPFRSSGGADYAACYTSYASVYTAVGAKPSPRPFSFPTPSPGQDGRLPTPVPTPANRPYVRLSIEGLLEAGWPDIFWDAAIIELDTTVYRRTAGGYLDFGTADSSIPTRLLSPVGTVTIEHAVHPELPVELQPLLTGSTVVDRVDIYRPSDRAVSEVIVVDPCPRGALPDEFVYYEAASEGFASVADGKATPSTGGNWSPGQPDPTPAPTSTPAPTTAPELTGVKGPRGRPGPRPFHVAAWSSDRTVYLPGEPIVVKFVLRSVWDKPLTVKAFPEKVSLYTDSAPEGIAITEGIMGMIPDEVRTGQEIEVAIEIPSSLTASLVPGRYSMYLQGQFTHGEESQLGGTLGWSSGPLFVIVPPQGAMDRTVAIGEARHDQGIRITLESIEFAPTRTTIVALAVPRDYKPTERLGPGEAPHGATALYRLDVEPWQELRGLGYRVTAVGVRLEWTLDPTPADAKAFGIRVTSFTVNPSVTVNGLWEWSVPVQSNE